MAPGGDCTVTPVLQRITREDLDAAVPVVLSVRGMGCINCAHRVRNALVGHAAVVQATVDLSAGRAFVALRPERGSVTELIELVREAGRTSGHRYDASPLDLDRAGTTGGE